MLRCSKLAELTLAPGRLRWPWVAFSPDRTAFAIPVAKATVALRASSSLSRETLVELPGILPVPMVEASHDTSTSRQPGLHAIALHPDDCTVVAFGWHGELPAASVLRPGVAPEVVDLGPALGDMGPMAATFARDGESVWLSAEGRSGAALVRLRFRDFGLETKVAFPAAPPPASHELTLHPVEDAVLLTMACGQDGTFVRVARSVNGRLELVAAEGAQGFEPCGVAEASEDGSLVCLVAPDGVELRRWPELTRVARHELPDELAANYCGVRIGGRFVVSATFEEDDGGEDDRALVLRDTLELADDAPAPPGMWAGRLGRDRLVTVSRDNGSERLVFVYAIEI